MILSFQCTNDKNGFAEIAQESIQTNTDKLHDDDNVTPADLVTFAWQIATGMVRSGLRTCCRDWPICLQ